MFDEIGYKIVGVGLRIILLPIVGVGLRIMCCICFMKLDTEFYDWV